MWPRGNKLIAPRVSYIASNKHRQRVLERCSREWRIKCKPVQVLSSVCEQQWMLKAGNRCLHVLLMFQKRSYSAVRMRVLHCCSVYPQGASVIYLRLTDTLIVFNFTAQTACLLPLCCNSVTFVSSYQRWNKLPAFSAPVQAFTNCFMFVKNFCVQVRWI